MQKLNKINSNAPQIAATPATQETGILLFSLQSQLEAERKPLLGKNKKDLNTKFWSALKQNTLKVISDTGLPVEQVHRQIGETFGERITHAVEACFQKGYKKLIVLGIDNPNLSQKKIQKVAQHLSHQDWVLEPCTDGGVNIIGVSQQSFKPKTFKQLSWQTDNLLLDLIGSIRKAEQSLSILQSQTDFDQLSDFTEWLKVSPSSDFKSLLAEITTTEIRDKDLLSNLLNTSSAFKYAESGRAPPMPRK